MEKIAYFLALPIILINPLGLINSDYVKTLGASFQLCFAYDQQCNIDSYAEAFGSALPLTLITYFAIYFFSENKENKLHCFLVIIFSYFLAQTSHA